MEDYKNISMENIREILKFRRMVKRQKYNDYEILMISMENEEIEISYLKNTVKDQKLYKTCICETCKFLKRNSNPMWTLSS